MPLTEETGYLPVLDALLDVLGRFTGEQRVHAGMWDGWGWWHAPGEDPAAGVQVCWDEGQSPSRAEIDIARAQARAWAATTSVQRPDVEPLVLPHRTYYVWTGPPTAVTAFRDCATDPPSLVWPEDRAWFVGAPIYTNEFAVAGTTEIIAAVLADARLEGRRATTHDELDGED